MCTEKHTANELNIVKQVFSKLPVIRVYIPGDAGFGNQVNAYFTVQRYLQLGYRNIFEIVYSQASADKVGTLFGMRSSDLKTNNVLQSWHPQIRFIKEESLIRFPDMFQHVPFTLSGAIYPKGFSNLKTDLLVAPDNGLGMYISAGNGTELVSDSFSGKFGLQIFTPVPTLNSIRALLRNTDYGKDVISLAPGVPAIIDSVVQQKVNVMVAYGMHWSFHLPNHQILAKISASVCQIKTEQKQLQKPTLILVLNELWWWNWIKIRSTLKNILAHGSVTELSNLADHLHPCATFNTTIPFLNTGVELLEYISAAPKNSLALVKMPNIHPDIYSFLVQTSPFPALYEGRSSRTLLTNLNKPGLHIAQVINNAESITPLIEIFRQFVDPTSKIWQDYLKWEKAICTPKQDLLFQTVLEVNQHLNLSLFPTDQLKESLQNTPLHSLNLQLTYLHFKDYFFSGIVSSVLISSGNTLYKRRATSYPTAALFKYGLLLGDGYINARLASNIALITIDLISDIGFESEIFYLAAIPILHNLLSWILYYPTSIAEAKQQSFEFASSCAGVVIGKVTGNIITNVACNTASWFYRRWNGNLRTLPTFHSNSHYTLDFKRK